MDQWFASDLGLNPIQLHVFLVFISPRQDKDELVQVFGHTMAIEAQDGWYESNKLEQVAGSNLCALRIRIWWHWCGGLKESVN